MPGPARPSGGGVLYEVTLEPEAGLGEAVERYLMDRHIPEILATGCFRRIRLDQGADGRLRTTYEAATEADLDRYFREHTGRFRADFAAHFPQGVSVRREVWRARRAWR